jgi:hypothetical protein
MRATALLWNPFVRLHLGRPARVPAISRASGRRLLGLAALVAALCVAGPASSGGGGELARRGLALAGDLASAAAGQSTAVPEDACGRDGLLLPPPGAGGEASDVRMADPGCDDWSPPVLGRRPL